MKHTLENSSLIAAIDTHGAELISLFDKVNKRDVLWYGDPAFWGRRSPILFPNVGKHFHNEYLTDGKIYPASQHGFARDMEFVLSDKTETGLSFVLSSSEETLQRYPYPFTLTVSYTLSESDLLVSWKVETDSNTPIYFTIGGHPAFLVPAKNIGKQTDYRIAISPSTDSLAILPIHAETGTILADQPKIITLENGSFAITEHIFDNDALVFDNYQIEEAALLFPDGSPYLSMKCKGFPCYGIWSKPGAPFVCLEPWMGRADDYGFEQELKTKKYINQADKEHPFEAGYVIHIY